MAVALDRMAVFFKATQAMTSSLEIDQVLQLVMDSLIEVTSAERGFVMMAHPDTGELELRLARNFLGETIAPDAFQVSRTILTQVFTTAQGLAIADAQGDEHFSAVDSVIGFQLRSVLCVPLRVKGRVTGVVYVDNRYDVGVFDASDLDLVQAVADQAAIALDNALLYAGLHTQMHQVAVLKEYQDNIFRSVSSAVIALDLTGRVTSANHAASQIFGFDPPAVVGQYYTAALGSDMSLKMLRPVARAVRGGPDYREETELRADIAGRGDAYLNLRVSSLVADGDQKVGLVLVVDDVTERRRLEDARQQEEAERLRIREIFGRQVADEVVEALLRDSSKLSLGGVRTEVTVLFADVRGYTSLAEDLPTEEVVRLLNNCFTIAAKHIREQGGWLDKFIGDAIVAVFNAPLPHADHADRAVSAAMAMQRELRTLHSNGAGATIQFGIGINTGEAIVGNIGSAERMNFTVIGDSVNVAQRLQSSASPGDVMISESTYTRLKKPLPARKLEPMAVKGRRERVHSYQAVVPVWS